MDKKSPEWLVLDVLAQVFDEYDSDTNVDAAFIEKRLKGLGTPLSKDEISTALEKLFSEKYILGFPKEKPGGYRTGMVGFLGWWKMGGEPVKRNWEK